MTHSVYITSTEAHCGKSFISLGMVESALRKTSRISIFKPIITLDPKTGRDKNIEGLLHHFQLDQAYEDTHAFESEEAQALLAQGKIDEVLDQILVAYRKLEQQSDFIISEGSDFISESSTFEFSLNVEIAKNLRVPVLIVGRGNNHRPTQEAIHPVKLAVDHFEENDCEVVGVVMNRVNPDQFEEMNTQLHQAFPHFFLAVIPENGVLKSPTIQEIAQHFQAEVLYGEGQLHYLAHRYTVAAMHLEHYLGHLTENSLIITPGDRGEIIIGTLEAHHSSNYPSISGIVLTGGLLPSDSIRSLLDGLPYEVPILAVKPNTYETAQEISGIYSNIIGISQEKIEVSKQLFFQYIDGDKFDEKISKVKARGMTPRMFLHSLTEMAKKDKRHIVLAEGNEERILRATAILLKEEIVKITLLGDGKEIEQHIHQLNLDIDLEKIRIVSPQSHPRFEEFATLLFELRKHKGMTMEMARDTMSDVSYFATMMVHVGEVDGMVSGATHTTQHTIRPALQILKTKPGYHTVSSVFFMCMKDRVLVYGDCAINPNPNHEQLAEIALSSAQTAQQFGIAPKMAMLSYSSGTSGKGAEVEKVREATRMVKEKNSDLKVEGPIQYDAAVDPEVGTIKLPGSEVAGKANVFIFPDLNTGNNTYKAIQRETGAIAVGPVLQGLRKPVNDLSRGATVPDIVNTVIITAIQAQEVPEVQQA